MRRLPSLAVWVIVAMHHGLAAPACAQFGPPAPVVDAPSDNTAPVAPWSAVLDSPSLPALDDPVLAPNEPLTIEAVREEIDQQAWRVGEFRVRPYGVFWSDMIYASSRVSPGSFSLFVLSRENDGDDTFVIDTRRSRLGLDVTGPPLDGTDAIGRGKVEIDFLGNFVTENQANVQLRHVYWELTSPTYRLLVGQTWDVMSPLIPGTLDAGYGYASGNIGFRRAQVRGERYLDGADHALTLQASLNQDIVADFPNDAGVVRKPVNWPVIEGRAALTLGARDDKLAPVLGVSGHVGEVGFNFTQPGPPPLSLPPADHVRLPTWSFNVDARVPLNERCGVQGELFMGANLSAFLGGIGQGVCPCLRVPIRSRGGWCEAWYDWTPRLHSHVGFGLDDPVNRDSLIGRTYNHFLFTNLGYDVTERLFVGLEFSWRKTLYHDTRVGQIPDALLSPRAPGEAFVVDCMCSYGF